MIRVPWASRSRPTWATSRRSKPCSPRSAPCPVACPCSPRSHLSFFLSVCRVVGRGGGRPRGHFGQQRRHHARHAHDDDATQRFHRRHRPQPQGAHPLFCHAMLHSLFLTRSSWCGAAGCVFLRASGLRGFHDGPKAWAHHQRGVHRRANRQPRPGQLRRRQGTTCAARCVRFLLLLLLLKCFGRCRAVSSA